MPYRFPLIILIFWVTLLFPLTATSAVEKTNSSQDPLVIAMASNYPPFTLLDINGNPAGMFVDIWTLWSKKVGHDVTFKVSDWAGTLVALKNGETDIHSGLYYSEQRDQWMDYSPPFYAIRSSFYHRIDNTLPLVDSDMKGMKVGVVKGYLQESFLNEAYPKAIIVPYANDMDLIKELAGGRIDVFLSEDPTLESLLFQTGMQGRIGSVGAPVMTNELYASVRDGQTVLLEEISTGFKQITLEEWVEIETRWIRDPDKRFFVKNVRDVVKLTTEEKTWITGNPIIQTIALEDWPPIDFKGVRGEHTGIAADILTLAADRVGLKVDPQFGPWPEMLAKLKQGKIDLAPEIYHTEARAKVLAYSRPFLPLYNAIFVEHDEKDIKGLNDLIGKSVAVEQGYAMEEFLKSTHPDINTLVVSSTLEALKLVSIGKVDAYVGSQYVASYLIDQNLLNGVRAIAHLSDTSQFLHMAVPNDRKILRDIMDKALGTITEKEKRTIINRYTSVSLSSASDTTAAKTIDLTNKERQWLKEHPVLRVAPDPDYPPIEFFDEKGRYQGVAADFMHLVAERLGVRLEAVKTENWTATLDALRNGKADFIAANAPIDEFKKDFIFTDTYYGFYDAIITHDGIKGSVNLEDLNGKEVLVAKDWPEEFILREQYPNIKVVTVESTLEGVTKVALKEYDYLFAFFPTASYLISKQALPGLRVAGIAGDRMADAAMFPKNSVVLRDLIQKGLDTITEEESRSIKIRWVPLAGQDNQSATARITLTDEEQAYIKAHPQLDFGIDAAWPPFEYLDKEGQYSGISSGVTEIVSEISGIDLEPEKGLPWGDVLAGLKSGSLKVVAMIQPTQERAAFLDFTKPYVSYPSVILTRNDAPFITGLNGLSGLRTGVGKGYSIEEYIKKNYPAVKLVPGENAEVVLKDLLKGKTEAVVMNLAVATYYSNKLNTNNIKIAAPTEFSIDLAMGVTKGNTVLLNILQKSLDAINEDEMETIKNRWVALTVSFGLDLKTILIWALPIGGGSLLIILFVVIWNRRLGNEILERKKAQEQQAESEERTRLILTSAGEGIFGVNLQGKIIFINDAACKMVGYSLHEIMGEEVHALIHHSRPDGSFYPVEDCPMRHAFTEGMVSRIDNEVLWRKDNTKFDVEYSSVPFKRNDEILGAVISFQDITARKTAQMERDDAYKVITSSIQYASRIQRSVLPPDDRLADFTSEHFIVWQPRDVVGGDLYWCEPWGDGGLIILGDCTGHGVPGAFMTLISTGALERSLLQTPEGDAASLISKMHQLIQLQLDQDTRNKTIGSDDGLELGLCYIPPGRKKIIFAGARMQLLIDHGDKIERIKSDKKGIGYRDIPFDFTYSNKEIEVKEGMRFFMTTDGIIDQIGGKKRRGFGYKRFLALLESLGDTSLPLYGERIYAELESFQGNERRRDDVSIIGFKM